MHVHSPGGASSSYVHPCDSYRCAELSSLYIPFTQTHMLGQDLHILPYTMPMTTLVTTAIDQISRANVRNASISGAYLNDLRDMSGNECGLDGDGFSIHVQ